MKDLVGKLTKKRNLVVDFCAGTCSTTKACLLLGQQNDFISWDSDSSLLSSAEPDLFNTHFASIELEF